MIRIENTVKVRKSGICIQECLSVLGIGNVEFEKTINSI